MTVTDFKTTVRDVAAKAVWGSATYDYNAAAHQERFSRNVHEKQ